MPFADELLGAQQASAMVQLLQSAAGGHQLSATRATADGLDGLALGARSSHLAASILEDLPVGYPEFAAIIRRALESSALEGWMVWPISNAVSAAAIVDGGAAAFDDGMQLLAELTPRLTCEWAVRPMLRARLERALEIMLEWTRSDNEHVRRLASEGTRPYLPWGTRVAEITRDARLCIPILDALYRDDSEVVRRSVANHLNDISRHDATLVCETAAAWLADGDEHTPRLVRHALRTLVKRGDLDALALLGFSSAEVVVEGPTLDRASMVLGEELLITASITNRGEVAADLVVDYVVHHVKADGSRTPKTFKISTTTLAPGATLSISKRHAVRPITTRRYHPGVHAIELQVNGVRHGFAEFDLVLDPVC
ncbi:DNA alkylation repair protein [Pseudoclavibacter sp. RFBI5]|uniref:DNA alkylation repair protein n=1 Tax=Pseudoclavibacter sp. RFBI5 TaxID=2080578 RepID=UPI000CE79967|nr:DNA alkylation repair protein [Pseudoclavibacter sp. RFBI5]PPG02413.1 DNA alkylation repair protein [Pseudoclavibacter sp. RFBI5]